MRKTATMPKARKPAGGKAAKLRFGGKPKARKKTSSKKSASKKMPFGATKAPGARKSQPSMKKAMGGKMPSMKRSRKKKK